MTVRGTSIWNILFWFLLRVTLSKSPTSFVHSLSKVSLTVPAPRAYVLGLEGRRPSNEYVVCHMAMRLEQSRAREMGGQGGHGPGPGAAH